MARLPQRIYLDYAAATPLDSRVEAARRPLVKHIFGNPSALHQEAISAKEVLEGARGDVAQILGTSKNSVFFLSGGTEANNLALLGLAAGHKSGHIITSRLEHASVARPIEYLQRRGWRVSYVPFDKEGRISALEVIKLIRPSTRLISIMSANNEVGAVAPIAEIGRLLLKYRQAHHTLYPYFHTDACQAALFLPLQVEKLHVDLMSLNAGKIYGPKGVGALYVRPGVKLAPIILGGEQEFGARAGTENVPGALGMAKALQIASKDAPHEAKRLRALADFFFAKLAKSIPGLVLNGPPIGPERLPGNVNVRFPGVEGEAMVIYLDAAGVAVSTGSACATGAGESSAVIKALTGSSRAAKESVRFSLGRATTRADLAKVARLAARLYQKLLGVVKKP